MIEKSPWHYSSAPPCANLFSLGKGAMCLFYLHTPMTATEQMLKIVSLEGLAFQGNQGEKLYLASFLTRKPQKASCGTILRSFSIYLCSTGATVYRKVQLQATDHITVIPYPHLSCN